MKKGLYVVLFLIMNMSGYAQNQPGRETLRYFDTVKERYVTVNVEFISWSEQYRTVSGAGTQNAKLLRYQATKLASSNQWSAWELYQTMPMPYGNKGLLTELLTELHRSWQREPVQGNELTIRDLTFIALLAIPDGKSSPFWFDSDGDLHSFHKLYHVFK
jgi:hypothetical protein